MLTKKPKIYAEFVECRGCKVVMPRASMRISATGVMKDRQCKECRLATLRVSEKGQWFYARHKKDSCELCGFKGLSCQLDVDHIDGNHQNNNIENLQTLCANCHRLKSFNHLDGIHRTNNIRSKQRTENIVYYHLR